MHDMLYSLLTRTSAVRLQDNSKYDMYVKIIQDATTSAEHNAASHVSHTLLLERSLECKGNEIATPFRRPSV